MDHAKPSLELVSSLTDEHVLRALMEHRRLTRAELAARIGISKPTAGESVRRLAERGLVVDTGERTQGGRGRGRVGSYYALTENAGTALTVSIAPEGVVAECVDAYGDTRARATRALDRPARPEDIAAAVRAAVEEVATEPRLAVVSAADPVDRATGRLIQLPDAPFLLGELDPADVLAPYVDGPVVVDNDVNWAARAEEAGDDFAYLFLGEGLGCAIVHDGEVRRGGNGLAGELAHVITVGEDGSATPFIEVFGQLGLRRPGSTAIDPARLIGMTVWHRAIGEAVSGVLAAIVALADPAKVVVGGDWGPALLPAIGKAFDAHRRRVPLQAASVTDEPALNGARGDALNRLRADIVSPGRTGRSERAAPGRPSR
ncbi:ROK family transcriptional regulator [Tenggerimyces flavus]|uniref:ROK family transcriptional regulator n=1 Tax=Tenggerimyces flavus TaxID=1708749 RepID=A0ABV7YC53_9ACTN|nr:ROK family transcriptional regulator [Tenggerimyces flavus]MBM7783754.1 putative NBD/HSP70 family sugar kinase [Tenggerimyces flavus]